MCQLSLIDLGKREINSVFSVVLMRENSRIMNRDGCGIFNSGRTLPLKSAKAASSLMDLGIAFIEDKGQVFNDSPILCHVRAASVTLANKLLTQEHAHPFRSVHYVLAHNGTLNFKNKEKEEEYKDKEVIDSEIFLAELEKVYTGNVYNDLLTTMDLFKGKFAFLIYHIPEDKYYVVKGKTATLFSCEFEINGSPGIIVNTERISFEDSIVTAKNVLLVMGHVVVPKLPKIIEDETVHVLDKETHQLVLLGPIKETPKEVAPPPTNFQRTYYQNGMVTPTTTGAPVLGVASASHSEITDKIVRLSLDNQLDIFDLDKISVTLIGKCLLEFIYKDPTVLLGWLEKLVKRNNPKYIKLWKKMCFYNSPRALYKRYIALSFPYFLTEMKLLEAIFERERARLLEQEITVSEE